MTHLLKQILETVFGLSVTADSELDFQFEGAPAGWIVFFLILGLAMATGLLYRTELRHASTGKKILLAALRFSIVLVVLLILFEPVLWVSNYRDSRGVVIVLVDTSYSMARTDRYSVSGDNVTGKLQTLANLDLTERASEIPRLELVKRIFQNNDGHLIKEFAKRAELVWGSFDSRPRLDTGLNGMKAVGASTDLGTAIQSALNQYSGRQISAIVVISDGQHNAGGSWKEAADRANARKVPIFAVGVGDERLPRDLEVVSIVGDKEAPAHTKLSFKVAVRASQMPAGTEMVVHLEVAPARDDNTTPNDEEFKKAEDPQTVALLPGQERVTVEFTVKPEEQGDFVYRARVEPNPEEENKENNQLLHTVSIKDNRIKVLFVDGLPRYEYRFLRSLLIRDDKRITAWIYLLDADEKFTQDHTEGTFIDSNGKEHTIKPLTELPIRMRTPVERSTGRMSLMEFDLVILGDVDPNNPKHKERFKTFFKDLKTLVMGDEETGEKGGGALIMVAGERFAPMAYSDTPIADILPIQILPVDPVVTAEWTHLPKPYRYRLTQEGIQSRILRLKESRIENEKFWVGNPNDPYEGVPPFYWYYPVEKVKKVASVLLRHGTDEVAPNEKYPLIVTGPAGAGQSMFIALDSLWRWRRDVGDRYYHRFWLQAIQELSGNKFLRGRKVAIELKPSSISLGDAMSVQVNVLDNALLPGGDILKVKYQVTDGKVIEIELKQKSMDSRAVAFAGDFNPEEIGEYEIWVENESVSDAKERKMGLRRFRVRESHFENRAPNMNRELLTSLAAATQEVGGRFVLLHDIATLPTRVEERDEKVVLDPDDVRPHNRKGARFATLLVLLFLGLLVAEWLLRKKAKLV